MTGKNIMIVGVGGQGTLLTSRLLGAALLNEGFDVKVSEVHGMSQRGGSVVTCVKIGDNIHSPLIDEGQADIILAFEQLEAVRWIKYLKKGGTVITNIQKINPMPVVFGQTTYPDKILDILADSDVTLHALDAFSLAVESGTSKAVNIVLLGVLSRTLPEIPENIWQDGLTAVIPAKLLDVNTRAFEKGRNYIEG